MTPEQLMAIPPQDRIQIQTVVRERSVTSSFFLIHSAESLPWSSTYPASRCISGFTRCLFDEPEMYRDVIYLWFLNAQYTCVTLCVLLRSDCRFERFGICRLPLDYLHQPAGSRPRYSANRFSLKDTLRTPQTRQTSLLGRTWLQRCDLPTPEHLLLTNDRL